MPQGDARSRVIAAASVIATARSPSQLQSGPTIVQHSTAYMLLNSTAMH